MLEGSCLVCNQVEGAMEGEGEPHRGLDETGGSGDVESEIIRGKTDGTNGKQGTADDGGGSCVNGGSDIALHHAHLSFAIDEIAFAGTNEDVNL